MTYTWATWLPDALAAEGCRVVRCDGWKGRGRPASTGDFAPYAAGVHHTGTHTSTANPNPTLDTCIHGRPDLPGPLCHVLVGYDGTCFVVAAGRANHAGESNGNGPLHTGDGNAQMIGTEVDYDGSQPMSGAQYEATLRVQTAVVKHFGHDETYVRGHKEWSTTGKWDPGGYSMTGIRDDVARRLHKGGDDMPEYVSLTGPGLDLTANADWVPVKFDEEKSDKGEVHSDEYAWLNLKGADYDAMLVLNDVYGPAGSMLSVRWAEYDTAHGAYQNAVGEQDHPLPGRTLSLHDQVIDTCGADNKVRAEVRAVGGDVSIGSVGVRALYWR